MNISSNVLSRLILATAIPAVLGGCFSTDRKTVLSSGSLKVVAVTESVLDINISQYRHSTSYKIYLDGRKLSDPEVARLLRAPHAAKDRFIHRHVVVLDNRSMLLTTTSQSGMECWTTHFAVEDGTPLAETLVSDTYDCSPQPAPPGWQAFYGKESDLLLVREQPYKVHAIGGYQYPLWIEGDVVALYEHERKEKRMVLRLVRISSLEVLAEEFLPMQRFEEPDLVHAKADARLKWFQDNFTASVSPTPSIHLREDNQLKTITPETWAEREERERLREEEYKKLEAERAAREARECCNPTS